MQQIYSKIPRPKCDFNKVIKSYFSMGVIHIFKSPFPKNTSEGLILVKGLNSEIYEQIWRTSHFSFSLYLNFSYTLRIVIIKMFKLFVTLCSVNKYHCFHP